MNRIAAVVAGLSLAFVGTSATIAGTINVPGDQPTITAAISASVNGDVIAIAAGTYNEHSLNPDGKAITIQGTLNGDGSLATIIDAQQGGSVFLIESGEGSGTVINDLILTGGTGFFYNNNSAGGGIYCYASSPTISGCTISDNTANYGGGILCFNSNPIISDCTITGNTVEFSGGGIACSYESNPTITGCTIQGNTCNLSRGGGIYCEFECFPTIIDCTITDNTADYGGGIACFNDNYPTISGSLICGNAPDQIVGPYTASGSCIEQSCDPCASDSDDDGIPDYLDQCPGYDDHADADGDGMADGCDTCPEDPLNADTDSDGTPDCIDGCPDDPLKTEPGICGCDVPETTVIGDLDCDGDYDIDDAYAAMTNFGITTGTPGGDVNADGSIDTSDLDELRGSLGLCTSDTDMDGDTDIEDLLNVIGSWGNTCTP